MTDFQGIGAVSTTLKSLLEDRIQLPSTISSALVTIGPPRTEATDGTAEKSRVNLFLYRVTENGALRNQELPGATSSDGYGHPPLSVDLHYLVTTYGSTVVDDDFVDETRAHLLLGSAMRVLHDYPVVTEDLRTVRTTPERPILDVALQGEFENVKLTLDPISLEDLSKVWTALTLPYRLSAAYKVTVVQIESRLQRRSARPVAEPPAAGPRVTVLPIRRPRIVGLFVRRQGDPSDLERPQAYARIGDRLVIRGASLGGGSTRVLLGTFDATAAITSTADDRLELLLPNDAALQPGALPVQVRVTAPGLAAPLITSNSAVFVLVPKVATITFKTNPKRFHVEGLRLFADDLESMAILGDRVIPSSEYTTSRQHEIWFRLPPGMAAGTYSLRVRVNGAESIDEGAVDVT